MSASGDIPIGRGLGASAAARAAGIVGANAIMGGPLNDDQMLTLGANLEGHADNMAPALFGGLRVVVRDGDGYRHIAAPIAPGLKVVLFIPDFDMPTGESRKLLPQTLSKDDAVHNIGRAALLVAALGRGEWDALDLATQDRIHQPARAQIFKAMPEIFAAAKDAGALCAYLSGGGSTIAAFATDGRRAHRPRDDAVRDQSRLPRPHDDHRAVRRRRARDLIGRVTTGASVVTRRGRSVRVCRRHDNAPQSAARPPNRYPATLRVSVPLCFRHLAHPTTTPPKIANTGAMLRRCPCGAWNCGLSSRTGSSAPIATRPIDARFVPDGDRGSRTNGTRITTVRVAETILAASRRALLPWFLLGSTALHAFRRWRQYRRPPCQPRCANVNSVLRRRDFRAAHLRDTVRRMSDLSTIVDEYIAATNAWQPVGASSRGFHEHDARLGDRGPAAVEARMRDVRGFLDRMRKLDARVAARPTSRTTLTCSSGA